MRHPPPPASVPYPSSWRNMAQESRQSGLPLPGMSTCTMSPGVFDGVAERASRQPSNGSGQIFCMLLFHRQWWIVTLLCCRKKVTCLWKRSTAISSCVTPSSLPCPHSPLSLFTWFPCLAVLYHPCTFSLSSSDRVGVGR